MNFDLKSFENYKKLNAEEKKEYIKVLEGYEEIYKKIYDEKIDLVSDYKKI
ncbi:MAG: hypothetical protein ACRCZ0_09810 [Cetobacterium sp.]